MLEAHALDSNPYVMFDRWLNDARNHESIKEPTAMALATADHVGRVSCRIVLLKEHSNQGFTFFTNHATSRKSLDIQSNPHAALCFYWEALDRQVRIEGRVERVADGEADAYFESRARGSQIGAWASYQSETLDSRTTLEERIAALEQQYAGRNVPRPPHWHGWRVIPHRIEFWQQRDYRLHDRFIFDAQEDGSWKMNV
jgi:pyridoxamine-phosphate oxidase